MKNQLKKDIRHLGKLLGKVIAEQEGDEVYRQVEAARALSFDIARGMKRRTRSQYPGR